MIALSEPGILRALGVKDETVGSCQLIRCSGGRHQQRIVIVFGSGSPQTLKVRRRRHEQPGWRPRHHVRRRKKPSSLWKTRRKALSAELKLMSGFDWKVMPLFAEGGGTGAWHRPPIPGWLNDFW